ncbi:MAG: tRNA dihydrouridine synthase DusB [Candidatus Omnitrophica bacterium]|nr:tRNA dihydrouridine synthase DusB [Candidatus Omnitrophota bacterium]
MVKIGSTTIPTKIFLAPMAGCSDLSFRLIAREHGAKFCFFEMVDCNSITYGPKRKVRSILRTTEEDAPIAAQLLGRNPDAMLRGAKEILSIVKVSFLDINAACPAKKVIKKRAGSYLLKDPQELCGILKTLTAALPVPVTVKIRTGYDEPDIKGIAGLAKNCEKSGAKALFVHGRTRLQGYMGEVDYRAIKAVKESVNIPVFGSGNIFSLTLAKKMLDETGCDGILVARGALGNPWIIKQIEDFLFNGRLDPLIDFETKKNVLKKHLAYMERFKESTPSGKAGHMRKVMLWYLRGFPKASRIREKVSLVNSYEKMIELIGQLKNGGRGE